MKLWKSKKSAASSCVSAVSGKLNLSGSSSKHDYKDDDQVDAISAAAVSSSANSTNQSSIHLANGNPHQGKVIMKSQVDDDFPSWFSHTSFKIMFCYWTSCKVTVETWEKEREEPAQMTAERRMIHVRAVEISSHCDEDDSLIHRKFSCEHASPTQFPVFCIISVVSLSLRCSARMHSIQTKNTQENSP